MRENRHSPAVLDAVLARYLDWRQASAESNYAYGAWRQVGRADRERAFSYYLETLDAEERAAEEYRASVDHAQRVGAR